MAITALPDDAALDSPQSGQSASPGTSAKITELPADAKITPIGKDVPDYVRPAIGANRAIADIAGAPVDMAAHALSAPNFPAPTDQYRQNHPDAAAFLDALDKGLKSPVLGSEWIKQHVLGAIGDNPDAVKPPTTPTQKLLDSSGYGAASMALPGMGAEAALAKVGAEGDSFAAATANILKGKGAVSNTAIGAASGAGSELGHEIAPNSAVPPLLGGLAGGLLVGGIEAAGRGIGGAIKSAYDAITEPAELRGAREIEAHASDPQQFRADLANAAEAPDLVQGSQPTTFQATGDLGVGSLERQVNASPEGQAPFAARREAQNTARLDALNGLADANADPAAVTDYVKARLQDITDTHAANVATAAHGVADSLAQAGGTAFDNPAAYGDALRAPLASLHQQAKDSASALWRAIDPDMSAPVNVTPLKVATADLVSQIPEIAKQPEGEEASILKGIDNLGKTTDFGSMVALRSRLTDAMRAERQNGSPTVLRRLAMVLDNVDDTLANTAGEIAQGDSDAVARGEMAPEEAMQQRLATQAKGWYDKRNAAAETGTGPSTGGGVGGNAGAGPRTISRMAGTEVQAGGGIGLSPGDQGVQAAAGGLSPEVADRYAAARGATKDLKTTYESGPVGGVLAPGAQYGSFKTTASNVAKNLFDRPEALQSFIDASKGNPDALAPMQDYAAYSLRQAAVKDGMLSPAKYQQWVSDHGYALRQFPELADKFANVESAQATLDNSLAAQKEALTDYQTKAVSRLVGGQDPVQAVGKTLADPAQFSALVAQVRNDPAALAGMKRAVVDFMMGKATGTAEAGTSGLPQISGAALQKFYLQNHGTLSALFSNDELNSMGRVAADVQRASRSVNAVRIPGGSNTAQDTGSRAMSAIGKAINQYGGKAIGLAMGSFAGPFGTAAGVAGGTVVDALRGARADSINKAVTEMMLDPKMAAAWLAKIPPKTSPGILNGFARQMRALSANQVAQAIAAETPAKGQ